jgi:hypothetical protein
MCVLFITKKQNVFVFHIYELLSRVFLIYSRLGFQPAPPPLAGEDSEWSVSFLAPHLDSEESSSSDSEEEDDSSALLGLPHPLSGQARKRYTFILCCGSGSMIHIDPHHFGNLDPHPHQIKIHIRNRIRIRINLEMTSQNVWNISLFYPLFKS